MTTIYHIDCIQPMQQGQQIAEKPLFMIWFVQFNAYITSDNPEILRRISPIIFFSVLWTQYQTGII